MSSSAATTPAGDREVIRQATHAGPGAGYWYTSLSSQLQSQLDNWLDDVKTPVKAIGPRSNGHSATELPVADARVIISPHAGLGYSGPAAAWAYKTWDVSKAKRVFVIGPSHHYYLTKAALTKCTHYATPLGRLKIDRETTAELHKSGLFEWMSQSVDEEEHSLEMQLPYIYRMLARTFGDDSTIHPPLIPIMVGNASASMERSLGTLLAPYLADPTTAWVISSDFAHWGSRFRYTYYRPSNGPPIDLMSSSSARTPKSPPIHESIREVDFECMGACESGSHNEWQQCLSSNGNTVCGRHPIGVIMAAIEQVREMDDSKHGTGEFRFVRYERSSKVHRIDDSSVSYASAFAVV